MNIGKNFSKAAWHTKNFGFKRLIYSAGMPRSGSTLLFNMLKLILQSAYNEKLRYGWVEDVDELSGGDVYLIKTHHLNRMGIWRANRTYYTYRDIRDVLVSRLRKFENEPSIGIVRYYIRQYDVAKQNDVIMFKYEEFIHTQFETIEKLAASLDIQINPMDIQNNLPDPAAKKAPVSGHDDETLLHKGHVTGTKQREWEKILPQELQDQIHSEFGWWFKENSYKI